jgi:predicted O-methyltransferase YrrM
MTRDLRLGALAAIATVLPGALLMLLGVPGDIAIIVTVAAAVAVVVVLGRRWHRQSTDARQAQTVHLRSAIGIAAMAGDIPVHWTEHAIAPESFALVQQLIRGLGARHGLELGSGLSTLLLAQSFRRAGAGHLLSFDDDERWAAQSALAIKREGLEAFAEVRVAPLKPITSGGRQAPWYDLSSLDKEARFDFVIVDGPPAWKGDPMARLPALYELRRHLSDRGVLILDDAVRGGETAIANQWQRDFPDLHFRKVNIGRGLFVVSLEKSTLDMLPL